MQLDSPLTGSRGGPLIHIMHMYVLFSGKGLWLTQTSAFPHNTVFLSTVETWRKLALMSTMSRESKRLGCWSWRGSEHVLWWGLPKDQKKTRESQTLREALLSFLPALSCSFKHFQVLALESIYGDVGQLQVLCSPDNEEQNQCVLQVRATRFARVFACLDGCDVTQSHHSRQKNSSTNRSFGNWLRETGLVIVSMELVLACGKSLDGRSP